MEDQNNLKENLENRRFICPIGFDYTEYVTSPEKETIFHKMCIAELKCKRPVKECYMYIVEALNLEAELKNKPKRAFIQGNPKNN